MYCLVNKGQTSVKSNKVKKKKKKKNIKKELFYYKKMIILCLFIYLFISLPYKYIIIFDGNKDLRLY